MDGSVLPEGEADVQTRSDSRVYRTYGTKESRKEGRSSKEIDLANAKFTVFLVLRFLSTFDMFFSRHNSTRKYHKTFSCNLFGVHVLLVHILTLLHIQSRVHTNLLLHSYKTCSRRVNFFAVVTPI